MKSFAYLLNTLLIGLICWEFYKKGLPTGSQSWVVILICATPIINSLALWLKEDSPKDNLISLFVKRKILEERHKIAKLTNEDTQ